MPLAYQQAHNKWKKTQRYKRYIPSLAHLRRIYYADEWQNSSCIFCISARISTDDIL
jgi:hypothetical protein